MPYAVMQQCAMEVAYYGPWPWWWLLPRWDTVARVRRMQTDIPTVILSAGKDRLIPPHHQQEVFDGLPGNQTARAQSLLLFDEEALHNDIAR